MSFPTDPPKFPSNYPNGTPAPLKVQLVIGESIPFDKILSGESYVLQDDNGRVLCTENGGSTGEWEWAYMGDYKSYPKDVVPVRFSTYDGQMVMSISGSENYSVLDLITDGASTNWDYVYWGYYLTYSNSILKFKIVAETGDKISIHATNIPNSADMALCCPKEGSYNWAFIGNPISYQNDIILFTAHKFYLKWGDILYLLKATWPNSNFDDYSYKTHDDKYELINDVTAKTIWENSGLKNYIYSAEQFDCDDYAFVYKGQASIQGYINKVKESYAVGFISGIDPDGHRHACNVLINLNGQVEVIDPQNGTIVQGSRWENVNNGLYNPDFILF